MARRYEFNVLVARTISHSFASLTREVLFLPIEHKIHIFSPPCNILYVIYALASAHEEFDAWNEVAQFPYGSLGLNRPFPSSPGSLFQNEGRCSAFDMEIIFHSYAIKLIFKRKVVHLASFWKWGCLELGSGLFMGRHKLDTSNFIDSNVDLFMSLIEGIRLRTWKDRPLIWALVMSHGLNQSPVSPVPQARGNGYARDSLSRKISEIEHTCWLELRTVKI